MLASVLQSPNITQISTLININSHLSRDAGPRTGGQPPSTGSGTCFLWKSATRSTSRPSEWTMIRALSHPSTKRALPMHAVDMCPICSAHTLKAASIVSRRFTYLHSRIEMHIRPGPNQLAKTQVSSRKRLALALYRLATGGSFTEVGARFGLAGNTCSVITRKVCHAICKHMMAEWIRAPTGAELAKTVAKFKRKGFPMCGGVVDGCHIPQSAPRWTQLKDIYHNSEGFFSIKLQVRQEGTLGSPRPLEEC